MLEAQTDHTVIFINFCPNNQNEATLHPETFEIQFCIWPVCVWMSDAAAMIFL